MTAGVDLQRHAQHHQARDYDGCSSEVIRGLIGLQVKAAHVVRDGELISGTSALGESMITGESLLVSKGPGDEVIGATLNTVLVDHGTPVRLTFRHDEAVPCSETVLFDAVAKSAHLAQGQPVSIELMPDTPGRSGFAYRMGVYRGTMGQ